MSTPLEKGRQWLMLKASHEGGKRVQGTNSFLLSKG